MTDLALFDLDNTLLQGDSDHAWGEYLCEIGSVNAETYRAQNERYYRQYRDGDIDINEYLNFALRPLARRSLGTLLAWRGNFIRRKIAPMVTPDSQALLDRHRADVTVIITSTNRFITAPIAGMLGVDALIATELEYRCGRYTGKAEHPPCFREGKIERLNKWLEETKPLYDRIWCYSDSINDLPLLNYADKPVVVNGDAAIVAHARARNWSCVYPGDASLHAEPSPHER